MIRSAIAAALALTSIVASAKWENVANEWPDLTPGQREWFIKQHNRNGFLCCSEADGHPTDWDIRKNTDGSVHYWAIVENEWRQIPEEAVIEVPNQVHRAVIWFSAKVTDDKGKKIIRCFIPGPGA